MSKHTMGRIQKFHEFKQALCRFYVTYTMHFLVFNIMTNDYIQTLYKLQGGSNMTGTDLYVNRPHCAAAVRP